MTNEESFSMFVGQRQLLATRRLCWHAQLVLPLLFCSWMMPSFHTVLAFHGGITRSVGPLFVSPNYMRIRSQYFMKTTDVSADAEIKETESHLHSGTGVGLGLYRKFSQHAIEKLSDTGWFEEAVISKELSMNVAPAKGIPNSVVRISTKAFIPTINNNTEAKDLVRYARITLLETIPNSTSAAHLVEEASLVASTSSYCNGIQVLNFVVLPAQNTMLPVLGIDLVSLPGSKHLLLIDAQPMASTESDDGLLLPWDNHWITWYETHVAGNPNFPWGGDFPKEVQKYVSPHSLWTRLQNLEGRDPIAVIQEDVWYAFCEHLDLYLELLSNHQNANDSVCGPNVQAEYLEYRRNNDPAKPMLTSLYGTEWTKQVLDEVLFPQQDQ